MLTLYGGDGFSSLPFLQRVLQEALGLSILPAIVRTTRGKPYFPSIPGLHFNLSHSGGYLLCALGDCPVGVDIEVLRPRKAGLPRYALSDLEYEEYLALGGDWAAFYQLWTKKEAFVKYSGEGLHSKARHIAPTQTLHFTCYGSAEYCATLCAEEAAPSDIVWLDSATKETDYGSH